MVVHDVRDFLLVAHLLTMVVEYIPRSLAYGGIFVTCHREKTFACHVADVTCTYDWIDKVR